jgi:hypothetical protein
VSLSLCKVATLLEALFHGHMSLYSEQDLMSGASRHLPVQSRPGTDRWIPSSSWCVM